LFAALTATEKKTEATIANEQYEDAMTALSSLRVSIDNFFETVIVNADDASVRNNRLALLVRFRDATKMIADLSTLEG